MTIIGNPANVFSNAMHADALLAILGSTTEAIYYLVLQYTCNLDTKLTNLKFHLIKLSVSRNVIVAKDHSASGTCSEKQKWIKIESFVRDSVGTIGSHYTFVWIVDVFLLPQTPSVSWAYIRLIWAFKSEHYLNVFVHIACPFKQSKVRNKSQFENFFKKSPFWKLTHPLFPLECVNCAKSLNSIFLILDNWLILSVTKMFQQMKINNS